MENNKYNYFNILRFVGAMCIAILLHWNDHILPAINVENNLESINILLFYISKNGYVFVEMFYIISGFLFAKNYMNRINKKNGLTIKKFLTKRYIRIFPLVIISSIVMYILHFLYYLKLNTFFTCGTLKINRLVFDILFSGISTFGASINPLNGPLWYIGPLMICYILAYYLTIHYKKNKNYYIFFVPIIISIYIITNEITFFIFNINMARGLLSFFVGVLLGNKELENILNNLKKKSKYMLKAILLIIIGCFMYIILSNKSEQFIGSFNDTIITYSIIIFPTLLILLYDIKWLDKLGKTKLFQFLGNISFSIYIWNFPIIIVLTYLIKVGILKYTHAWELMVISIIIHLVIGTLSYYLIEKKSLKMLNTKEFKKGPK